MDLAILNSKANENSLKKNLERKILLESGNNVQILNQSEDLIRECVANMKKDAILQRYADPQEHSCFLSQKTWL